MKKAVFAYLRTSNMNSKIALDGDSKDRQLKSIRSYCRTKGWKVEDVFYDCSVSGDNGTDLSERDEWNEMMAQMKSNGIKTFVVADQSRFSRSILTAEIMKSDCREYKISAMDASTGNDLAVSKTENPEVALINNLLQAISEYDKLKTVQRLQSGRRKAKKKDKPIGGNYGYGSREGEGMLLNRIKELQNRVAHGRMSLQKITNTINAEGFRTRNESFFSKQQVHRIVTNLNKT